jgi:hypothetical protein
MIDMVVSFQLVSPHGLDAKPVETDAVRSSPLPQGEKATKLLERSVRRRRPGILSVLFRGLERP